MKSKTMMHRNKNTPVFALFDLFQLFFFVCGFCWPFVVTDHVEGAEFLAPPANPTTKIPPSTTPKGWSDYIFAWQNSFVIDKTICRSRSSEGRGIHRRRILPRVLLRERHPSGRSKQAEVYQSRWQHGTTSGRTHTRGIPRRRWHTRHYVCLSFTRI